MTKYLEGIWHNCIYCYCTHYNNDATKCSKQLAWFYIVALSAGSFQINQWQVDLAGQRKSRVTYNYRLGSRSFHSGRYNHPFLVNVGPWGQVYIFAFECKKSKHNYERVIQWVVRNNSVPITQCLEHDTGHLRWSCYQTLHRRAVAVGWRGPWCLLDRRSWTPQASSQSPLCAHGEHIVKQ